MSLSSENASMVMPVAPAYNNGCYSGGYGFGNGMWGGDWSAWIILFLIFGAFGRGGFGGFGDGCGAATRADLCSEFNFNNLDNAVRGVQNGLADGFYSVNTSLLNGFHGVDNAVCQLGYNTQQSISNLGAQMADCCCTTQRAIDHANFHTAQGLYNIGSKIDSCCCETQRQIERGFCDTNYALATNTTSIIQNAHNDTDRVIAKLDAMENARQQEKIAALQAENQSLKFQASQSAQNAFIIANQEAQTAELLRRLGRDCPVPAYWVNPPTPVPVPCGTCNTCGC